jgi:hypothetical protein
MDNLEQDAVAIAAPALSFALGLLFPEIPSVVWATIFAALKSGDLDAAAFDTFLAEHNLKIYQEFPTGKNGESDQSQ